MKMYYVSIYCLLLFDTVSAKGETCLLQLKETHRDAAVTEKEDSSIGLPNVAANPSLLSENTFSKANAGKKKKGKGKGGKGGKKGGGEEGTGAPAAYAIREEINESGSNCGDGVGRSVEIPTLKNGECGEMKLVDPENPSRWSSYLYQWEDTNLEEFSGATDWKYTHVGFHTNGISVMYCWTSSKASCEREMKAIDRDLKNIYALGDKFQKHEETADESIRCGQANKEPVHLWGKCQEIGNKAFQYHVANCSKETTETNDYVLRRMKMLCAEAGYCKDEYLSNLDCSQ